MSGSGVRILPSRASSETAREGSPRFVFVATPLTPTMSPRSTLTPPRSSGRIRSWMRSLRSTRSRNISFPMSRRARTRPARRCCSSPSAPGSSSAASARTAAISSRSGKRFGRVGTRESLTAERPYERARDGVPAVEIESRRRIRVRLRTAECESTPVARGSGSSADARIMLAVGVGEVITRPAKAILDLRLGLVQLAAKLFVGQRRQMRMRNRVRPNRDAAGRVLAQLVPVHGRQLVRIVAGKLGNRQRRAYERVLGTDEDLDGHSEPFQVGEDSRGAPKSVVESDVHLPEARQRANLAQQEIGLNRKTVPPGRRDGVVTKDERPTRPGAH